MSRTHNNNKTLHESGESRQILAYRVGLTLTAPFTLEDLCVACWERYGSMFGMHGYDHPDFHRFRSVVDGKHGMIANGYLVKVDGTFRIGKAPPCLRPQPPCVTCAERREMERMELTPAAIKYAEGRQDRITRAEAWQFWSIPEGDVAAEVVTGAITAAEALLRPREDERQRELWNAHWWLKQQFRGHLRFYEQRKVTA